MTTIYEADIGDRAPRFPALSGPGEADVVIVGGGFAGLATAFGLMERGARDVVLLEARTIGHGASGRNGGFVSSGFSLDASALLQQLGPDEARRLYRLSEAAVERIRQRIAAHGIACDAVYSGLLTANWFADERPLRDWQQVMRDSFGVELRWLPRDETRALLLSERYHSALHEPGAFHFNPLKYAQGEARVLQAGGVRVHERSCVTGIAADGAGWRIETTGGSLRCRQLVLGCGGYIGSLYRPLARAMLPIATYVMTTEPLGERLRSAMRTDAAVLDTRFAFDYYRPLPDTRLLWGGRISIRDRSPQDVMRLLTRDLLRVYPQLRDARISHAWSGLMSYARHKMPQLGRLPSGAWYAMGFGGHGVATTTLAGEVLAQTITGEAEIPAGLRAYGVPPTFGVLGRLAAQATYWWLQGRDVLHDWRTG